MKMLALVEGAWYTTSPPLGDACTHNCVLYTRGEEDDTQIPAHPKLLVRRTARKRNSNVPKSQ